MFCFNRNRTNLQADMIYLEALKKNNYTNTQGELFLFFDTKVIYDSGYIDIITTLTYDLNEPMKNLQIQERLFIPFKENIGEIIGNQHDIIIKHFNSLPRPI